MAFQKKARIHTDDRRPKGTSLERREAKVKALRAENTPEARKQLKKMNDKAYRGAKSNLSNWYAPKGKKVSANV